MKEFGFIKVGAIVPKLYLANPLKNAKEIIKMLQKAEKKGISIATTPELSLTGYTCGDLFLQEKLLNDSENALKMILEKTKNLNIISILGLPIYHENQLFNCAVVIEKGRILGIIPKTYIPNYSEFYEKRWFASSINLVKKEIEILGQTVPIDTNIIFEDKENKNITFGVEICEDLWTVNPPSNRHALNGANMIFNLSSSNEIIGKYEYRKNLVKMQSAKTLTAYIYASSGMMESTSDVLFSGASMIYERGTKLAENERYDLESNLIAADIDIASIINDRRENISFMGVTQKENYQTIKVEIKNNSTLDRTYKKYPFVPSDNLQRDKRCKEIIDIQATALARRLIQLGKVKCVIGISGGLDSTLAFLITIKAFQKLKRDPKDIIGITMPGFGTTGRTYENAKELVNHYRATLKEVSIKEATTIHMRDINLPEEDRSVTYENAQARERTQILMDVANMENGIVVGTGDLSELALGWCTYNGDHMSMYAINASIPKTLVRYLVHWIADKEEDKIVKQVIYDILDTPISPELLPPDEAGNILQKTENAIGPYVLHDFFLYYFLRYHMEPRKIYLLAKQTFKDDFTKEEIKKWLQVFIKRFFTQQFKRNCMPDSIKVGTISLSPRGDLRMPSDTDYQSFLSDIE